MYTAPFLWILRPQQPNKKIPTHAHSHTHTHTRDYFKYLSQYVHLFVFPFTHPSIYPSERWSFFLYPGSRQLYKSLFVKRFDEHPLSIRTKTHTHTHSASYLFAHLFVLSKLFKNGNQDKRPSFEISFDIIFTICLAAQNEISFLKKKKKIQPMPFFQSEYHLLMCVFRKLGRCNNSSQNLNIFFELNWKEKKK